jgi:uncharacterized membrane protein YdjX (TVP38/TMEM64 family)
MAEPEGAPPQRPGLFLVYFAGALALLAAGFLFRPQLQLLLAHLQGLATRLGPATAPVLAVFCGFWGTLCLPGPLMQGTVGTILASQPLLGVAVVLTGEGLAQTLAFTIARYLGRDRVKARLQGQPWFANLEEQTARRGVVGVFLFRLMPFCPNALGSYAFGLTSIAFWPYLLASVLGSAPKMFVYIYGMTSIVGLFQAGAMGARELVVAVLTVAFLLLCGRALQVRIAGQRPGLQGSTKETDDWRGNPPG